MTQAEKWDLVLKTNMNPCFICHADTYEMIYVNEEFSKLLPSNEAIIGEKFYQIIPNDNRADYEDIRLDWEKHEVIERQLDNRRLGLSFFVKFTLMTQENVIFGLMTPTEESRMKMSDFEEAMSKCTLILGQSPETVMIDFCELLSHFYEAERAYVYRFHFENNTINCMAQWCLDPAFHVTEEVGTKMDASLLLDWVQNDSKDGLVVADSGSPDFDHDSVIAKIMSTFNMKNVTLAKVEDSNQKVVGVVGLSNRANFHHIFDNRLITTISRFVAQDVTKHVVDSTLFKVHHRDALTGLYNRVGYARRTEKIKETPPKTLGVISVNVNGLKNINQNLGNEQGDLHIKKSAQRIKSHFGYDIYRVSGDEFIGIASDVEKEEFEEKVAQLHEEMRAEHNYDFSMGSSYGTGNYDIVALMRDADSVMYINKQEYYSSSNRGFDNISNAILRDLLRFLENGEFMIYLQPQVRLSNGTIHGAEALIRRYDKTNEKMVFPDQFISLYEQNSVIRHIDLFVVESVCQLLAKWENDKKALPISVNLSRVTLMEYGIVDSIVEICEKYKIPHSLLVIEVTERVGLVENDVPSALITSFIDNGFTISLDDFGSAYSNIVTLAQIQVDELKLDKSLVDNITNNRKNHILVKNVLSMCDELKGMTTLAEGIEELEQAYLLHKLGCHLGQGYYYSRPIPVEDFEKKYINKG